MLPLLFTLGWYIRVVKLTCRCYFIEPTTRDRGKKHLWRFERVVGRKVDVKEKDSPSVWAVRLKTLRKKKKKKAEQHRCKTYGSHNGGCPVEKVITDWSSRTACRWVTAEVLQLLRHERERQKNEQPNMYLGDSLQRHVGGHDDSRTKKRGRDHVT